MVTGQQRWLEQRALGHLARPISCMLVHFLSLVLGFLVYLGASGLFFFLIKCSVRTGGWVGVQGSPHCYFSQSHLMISSFSVISPHQQLTGCYSQERQTLS